MTYEELNQLKHQVKQLEVGLDTVILALPMNDDEMLTAMKVRASRRRERYIQEQEINAEYEQLKTRLKEIENDYPYLKAIK